ncbi:MAG: hypothetical protein U0R26_05890 [Solirubrobacterales bacterium]
MHATKIPCAGEEPDLERDGALETATPAFGALVAAMVACNNARVDEGGEVAGDPTEAAMVLAARGLGFEQSVEERARSARRSSTSTPR